MFIILFRNNSDHARAATDFIENYQRRYSGRGPLVEYIETREGAATANLYDVTQYPAIIVTTQDGQLLSMWEGLPLPLIDEVAGLALESRVV